MKSVFNEVSFKVAVEDGWEATKATYRLDMVIPLVLIEFNKAGEQPVRARLDMGKQWFIDQIPMNDYSNREQEVCNLAREISIHVGNDMKQKGM